MEVRKGMHVVYVDTLGKDRDALVTAVHGPADKSPSINLVVVNDDDAQTDSYGNKTERSSSVSHQSNQWARGNHWRFVDEARVTKSA